MKICVVGLGYIGLPTALMMASSGLDIYGCDYNKELVATLQSGHVSFEEDGLQELFDKAVASGMTFGTEYIPADMYIVTVPTPYDEETKQLDPSYVIKGVECVMSVCPKGAICSIESTISPGSIDRHIRPFIESKGWKIGEDIHLVHTPERIIPGNMLYELEHNSRTIGADDIEIGEKVKAVYKQFCKGDIVVTDIRTAELTKVVENTFRDINIAFANELAKICRRDNLDVYEVIRISNMHPRVNILQPGPGVGGHCISVDPWFLVGDYPDLALLIRQAREINSGMPAFVYDRIKTIMAEKGITDWSKVGLYGLTYKENVDDTRESPTLQLLDILEKDGIAPAVYDPWVKRDEVKNQYHDFDKFLADSELVVLLVGHSQIRDNMNALEGKVILDTRNICTLDGVYHI